MGPLPIQPFMGIKYYKRGLHLSPILDLNVVTTLFVTPSDVTRTRRNDPTPRSRNVGERDVHDSIRPIRYFLSYIEFWSSRREVFVYRYQDCTSCNGLRLHFSTKIKTRVTICSTPFNRKSFG